MIDVLIPAGLWNDSDEAAISAWLYSDGELVGEEVGAQRREAASVQGCICGEAECAASDVECVEAMREVRNFK